MWPWTRHFPSQRLRLLKCDRRIKSPARPQRVLWGWNEIVEGLFSAREGQGVHHWEKKGAGLSIFLNHISKLQLDLCWSMGFFSTYHSMKNNFTSHLFGLWMLPLSLPLPPPHSQEAPSLSPEEGRFITPIQSSHHAAMTWTTQPQLANVDHFQQKMKHEICKNNEPFTEIPVAATG